MVDTHNIERSIIASLLNYEVVQDVESKYFSNKLHRRLIKGYCRLQELGESLDFELLRQKFIEGGSWTLQEDDYLLDIMSSTTPFGSQALFDKYYDTLKKANKTKADRRYSV